ncbi:MAG TPA: alpha/beta hydrolase [Gemmata sp.]
MSRRLKIGFAVALSAVAVGWLLAPVPESGFVYATPSGEPLRLDLDYPVGPGPHPVVLFAPHRGDWGPSFKRDDRCHRLVAALTGRGFAVATIHYRLVGAHRFPAQIEDGKAAVRWLRGNAPRLGLAADRVGVIGVSAGGDGACMLGTTGRGDGFDPPGEEGAARVQAVVALGAPADLTVPLSVTGERLYLRPYLGASRDAEPALYARASPGTYATPDDPPFLLIHATNDAVVPVAQPRAFVAQLRRAGVSAELVEEGGAVHVWGGERLDKTLGRVCTFLESHLRK